MYGAAKVCIFDDPYNAYKRKQHIKNTSKSNKEQRQLFVVHPFPCKTIF